MSSTTPDALVDTNDVWADQPSGGLVSANNEKAADERPSPPSLMQQQFDDFDPFKPESADDEHDQRSTDDVAAPPTPSKPVSAAPPVPEKQSNAATAASQNMTPSTSSSGLFGNIAAAFKKRDQFSASTSSSRISSPSKTASSKQTPAAILVPMRDSKDAAGAYIEDSEKSAMPAVPSHGQGAAQHDGNDAETDGPDAPPFDFNLFLEQMRSRPAEPIARYLRSFLKEFAKRNWSVNEQIRVINDYLDFIAVKMRENEVWKGCSDREFDNAVEAMEKLVMNRVYHQTFVPALAPAAQATSQTDDLERDHVFSQRIRLFGWVSETHLDLPQTEDSPSFLEFAKQELLKVNNYKAPRDKLICVLNCCKVIFGLMRHLGTDDGADTFIPFLILVVLRANPPHLISNVQYIQRFRNPDRLAGENGYYLSSLNGAISFIETLASSSLSNITEVEFADNVGKAIQQISAEQAGASMSDKRASGASLSEPGKHEEEASSPSLLSAPNYGPTRSLSPAEATRDFFSRSTDNLQKTVSKPLQALGKIFNEMGSDAELVAGVPAARPSNSQDQSSAAGRTPVRQRSGSSIATQASNRPRRGYSLQYQQQPSQTPQSPSRNAGVPQSPFTPPRGAPPLTVDSPTPTRAGYNPADYLDDSIPAAQVQAEADRQQAETFAAKISTLRSIFPDIEGETLEIVLISNGEDVERSIEGLLDMT